MRLGALLRDHRSAATPATYALSALMAFHAARLPARMDAAGNWNSLGEQDRARWDTSLTDEGRRLLDQSAMGTELTPYHVEAAIAAIHADAKSVDGTKLGAIVSLYDTLLGMRQSPVIALNRAIAVAQWEGPVRGLEEIAAITDPQRLASYPFLLCGAGRTRTSEWPTRSCFGPLPGCAPAGPKSIRASVSRSTRKSLRRCSLQLRVKNVRAIQTMGRCQNPPPPGA